MINNAVVIVAAKRTPMGGFMGSLAGLSATELGAQALKATVQSATTHLANSIDESLVDEVIMGCVLPAGLGQSPARQAAIGADLPLSCGVTTINKVCGSGMKAVMLAHDLICAGTAQSVLAGGMESMSNAPYLLPKARAGYRMGHGQVLDHMMLDGLENAYDGKAMGCFAQATADAEGISRTQMDDFALASLTKAKNAMSTGLFQAEICPLSVSTRQGNLEITEDDGPKSAKPEKIPSLKPAFSKDGTVTAANSSSISDGAAALWVMSAQRASELGLKPLARIVAHSSHAIEPQNFTVAPVGAVQKLLLKTGWQLNEVDLFEINEAFAMVTMLAINKLRIEPAKVNVNGGACALGHPIGASGARILVTLLHALQNQGLSKGIAAICIGGGEATAIALERC